MDRSVKRRRALEAEIASAGLSGSYRRYAAKDGATLKASRYGVSPGEAGCYLSHLGVLEAGRKGGRHFHVLEDDAVLGPGFAGNLAMVLDRVIDHFDIVFTDMWLPSNQEFIRDCIKFHDDYRASGAFNVISGNYWACMASYVVNINAADKLCQLLAEGRDSGMALPVDLHLANLVASGAIAAGCLFPFITSVRLPFSGMVLNAAEARTTISRPGDSEIERLMAFFPRVAFYIDADLPRLRAAYSALHVTDPRLRREYLNCGRALDTVLDRN
jgi:GR25 family glycosyltransferase involved in LPS biosynthesis